MELKREIVDKTSINKMQCLHIKIYIEDIRGNSSKSTKKKKKSIK